MGKNMHQGFSVTDWFYDARNNEFHKKNEPRQTFSEAFLLQAFLLKKRIVPIQAKPFSIFYYNYKKLYYIFLPALP